MLSISISKVGFTTQLKRRFKSSPVYKRHYFTSAKGHEKIRHYYNEVDFIYYTDPLILEAKVINKDQLETKWVREVAECRTKIFGFDRITLHKGKVLNVIVQLDEEKTREWNDHLDHGMLSEYVLYPLIQTDIEME